MTDIFDIKWLIIWFNLSYLNTILLIVVILWLLIYFFINYKKKDIEIQTIEKVEEEIYDFKNLLASLEERYNFLDSKAFLKEVNHIFRLFLEQEKKYENFSKLTLEQVLSYDLQHDYISFFKDLYFKEYNELTLETDEKKAIFDNLVKIISNS